MNFYEYYDNYLVKYAKMIRKNREIGKYNREKAIRLNETLLRWYDVWSEAV